jgi:hypothetical protein
MNQCSLPYSPGPNPAFERTAASALRLPAVPSSLRSSAAAQRERWASHATLASLQCDVNLR